MVGTGIMAGICTSLSLSPYPIEKIGDSPYPLMWPQQAQPQMHQQAKAHIKAQSLEAWWEIFTWASHKMIKSIMGFLHYPHGLKKSLKYEMMHEGSSLDLNWAIV